MEYHHVGIVVKDISIASKNIRKDFKIKNKSKIYVDKKIGVKVQFLNISKDNNLELIQPLNNKSPINNFLKNKNTLNIHHLAYKCKNLEIEVSKLKKQGYGNLTKYFNAVAFNKSRVIFLLSPFNYIVELIEKD